MSSSVSRRQRRARRRILGVVACALCGRSFPAVDCLGFWFSDDEGELSGYLCRRCQSRLGLVPPSLNESLPVTPRSLCERAWLS
jgi:DNA-directed RNA polymerase subunit RPC12/RpoP